MDFYPLKVSEEIYKNRIATALMIAKITFIHVRGEDGQPQSEYYIIASNTEEQHKEFIRWARKEFGYLKYELTLPSLPLQKPYPNGTQLTKEFYNAFMEIY